MKFKTLFQKHRYNRRTYSLARTYWVRLFRKDYPDLEQRIVFRREYPNGDLRMDGDPIIGVYFPEIRKAVRIIQSSYDRGAITNTIDIMACIDRMRVEGNFVQVLTIDLEMSNYTVEIVKSLLLPAWLANDYSESRMQAAIQIANTCWSKLNTIS